MVARIPNTLTAGRPLLRLTINGTTYIRCAVTGDLVAKFPALEMDESDKILIAAQQASCKIDGGLCMIHGFSVSANVPCPKEQQAPSEQEMEAQYAAVMGLYANAETPLGDELFGGD